MELPRRWTVACCGSLLFPVNSYFRLFAKLPAHLRWVWGMMLVGWPMGFAGLFMGAFWLSWVGGGLLTAAFVLAVADLFLRQRHRERAAGFHMGLCLGTVTGVVIMAFIAVLLLAAYLVTGFMEGFSLAYGLRLLAFMGLLYAGGIMQTIARQSKWLPQGGVKEGLSRP